MCEKLYRTEIPCGLKYNEQPDDKVTPLVMCAVALVSRKLLGRFSRASHVGCTQAQKVCYAGQG
jgi:hypothetical protein